ncbi:putative SAM domain-containing protein [Rosellinia necatrix]|uniref:Putative SAM domain-containing protein n=1 Tax=Rosellinia necatrix TaxID=77044 RepID=A0A1S7UMC3_ROSNE|nr:putative SAM domain-containing protein [Rosellinia necatrix]
MASRQPPEGRPEVGDVLVVIHDFQARSSDELSLAKGDRVELIERDDEFGDGWFLGRHLVNGNNGLFPEVYTRVAPKGAGAPTIATKPVASASHPHPPNGTLVEPPKPANPAAPPASQPTPNPNATALLPSENSPVTLPLSSMKQETRSVSAPTAQLARTPSHGSGRDATAHLNPSSSQDSQVLHETLTVINEHITDLHSPAQNGHMHHATDSGSEYSSHIQDRLSYIQGEETDEEEEAPHSRAEVEAWTADDVAEYLFTMGVEKKHCEVFRDQEIAGEVLLGMDQSSLFLKAFDLGSVGRRLKTWQKIKSLQDEVNGHSLATRRQTYGSDAGSEDSRATGRRRSRTNTLTNAQRLSIIEDRPTSVHARRLSQTPREAVTPGTPNSPNRLLDSPTKPSHQKRPSAASVRDLHHSRRHSSTDFRLTVNPPGSATGTPKLSSPGAFPQTETSHKKQPSFDRNWTMGAAPTQQPPRPLSSTGFQDITNASEPDVAQEPTNDLERGYFSGTELDGRRRTVLRKRDSVASHAHPSSYAEQQRVRSATALSRRSRLGSADFSRETTPPSAAQMYYGTSGDHRRTTSTATTDSYRPPPPAKDGPSPTVTKLDNNARASPALGARPGAHGDWLSNTGGRIAGLGGLRAISDAVTSSDRLKIGSPTDPSIKDSPLQSPTRTGSSTPSAGPSFDLESVDAGRSPHSSTPASSRKNVKKTKKETSAYLRGLQKTSPREAIKDADYSGWMKKKNSHFMTTWKPRLFVLKGRRLSYYYSEDDTEEKGLIDISFHRVLPADNERLTGLHATLTGASNTPMTPADSNLPTLAESDAAAAAAIEKGTDSMFIFKLVPPRAGLSKAVNFTKPTVHYFAVPNLQQGRAWMAALMKATIDRDDSQPMTSTYQQKTISLTKARQMRHRPPALMNLDEKMEESMQDDDEKKGGLGISFGEVDSAISGLENPGNPRAAGSATMLKSAFSSETGDLGFTTSPQSA